MSRTAKMTPEQVATARERRVRLPGEPRDMHDHAAHFRPWVGRGYPTLNGGWAVAVWAEYPAEIGYYHNGATGPFLKGFILPDGTWSTDHPDAAEVSF